MATTFVDYEGVVCADWLNRVSRTVEDALGSASTPSQARTAIGAIGEAPQDNAIYGRQNGSWVVVSVGGSPTSDYIIKTPVAQENTINPGGTGTAYPLIINAHASQDPSVPLFLVRDSAEDSTFEVSETGVTITEKAGQANEINLFAVLKADDTPVFRVNSGDATDDNIVWIGDNPQTGGTIKMAAGDNSRIGVTRFQDSAGPLLRLEADVDGTPSNNYALRTMLFHGHKIDSIPDVAYSTMFEIQADESASPSGLDPMIQLRVNEGTNALYSELVMASKNRSTGATAKDSTWQMVAAAAPVGTDGRMEWYHRNGAVTGARGDFVLRLREDGEINADGWTISTTGSLTPTSDVRLKSNIIDAGSKLNGIRSLRLREFDFDLTDTHETGFVAQEVADVFPELAVEREDGYLAYNESVLNRYLLRAVQELADQVEELRRAA